MKKTFNQIIKDHKKVVGPILKDRNENRVSQLKTEAKTFSSKADHIRVILENEGIMIDDEKLRRYTNDTSKVINDFISYQVKECGDPKGMLREMLEEKAKERIVFLLGPAVKMALSAEVDSYMIWNKQTNKFEFDEDKAIEDNTEYMSKEELEAWDNHTLVAEILTEFLGGSIAHERFLADYFDVLEDGTIEPSKGLFRTQWPPLGKDELIDNN